MIIIINNNMNEDNNYNNNMNDDNYQQPHD